MCCREQIVHIIAWQVCSRQGSAGKWVINIVIHNIHTDNNEILATIYEDSLFGVGCLLWVHQLTDILPQFLQLFMQYLTILDHVITALDCICSTSVIEKCMECLFMIMIWKYTTLRHRLILLFILLFLHLMHWITVNNNFCPIFAESWII